MRELIIVPSNSDSCAFLSHDSCESACEPSIAVEPIFEAMSLCASLHPDPNLSEEEEFDGDFVSDDHFETLAGDGDEELSEVGRVRSDFVNDNRYAPY